ncbi:MAG TPA: TraB/GumN family protein [Thermodesulfobacteriota bacterium]|nr:TraB/GumN family protein [Thermodesulfobacteriota bacterium]
MILFWWKEKPLRTVWKVDKDGQTSFLVGTAHFSPYRFKKTLSKLIQGVETVLFEGPLDAESMARVVQYGQHGENEPSLYKALHPDAIAEINKFWGARSDHQIAAIPYLDLIHPTNSDFLEIHTRGLRPWMTFFTIWSAFLNWKHSMDLEAFHIAQKLGKKIDYLETIEDQLAALDGIPFERIVNYLNHIGNWRVHKKVFTKAFLEGDIQQFFSMTGEFPTRCESIIAKRDPIFFKRMKLFFEKGKTVAFVGVAHIPGIRKMFLDEGYRVIQEES